jgi:hypothetical protein
VRPDPFLFPVVGRAQIDDLLEVAPAALDFQRLLVASAMSSAESLGSEVRSRYLPSRFSSALILAAPIRSRPPGVTRRYRFRPGLVEMTPRSSARLVLVSLSLSLISSPSWASIR